MAATEIKFRYLLLQQPIDNIILRQSSFHNFKNSSSRGRFGLNEGLLPHVADAIHVFNVAWKSISKLTITKCWLKAEILPLAHREALKRLVFELKGRIFD